MLGSKVPHLACLLIESTSVADNEVQQPLLFTKLQEDCKHGTSTSSPVNDESRLIKMVLQSAQNSAGIQTLLDVRNTSWDSTHVIYESES